MDFVQSSQQINIKSNLTFGNSFTIIIYKSELLLPYQNILYSLVTESPLLTKPFNTYHATPCTCFLLQKLKQNKEFPSQPAVIPSVHFMNRQRIHFFYVDSENLILVTYQFLITVTTNVFLGYNNSFF